MEADGNFGWKVDTSDYAGARLASLKRRAAPTKASATAHSDTADQKTAETGGSTIVARFSVTAAAPHFAPVVS